ncbi:hypothetical protein [Pseudomonas putida]|uniref:hypothetical protein n=1 Tax=Pseudomonas putida TaxID=303 RepID=UPI00236340E8|nr:hypothetical protein [Pseudomonas putida]MDD2005069.1 hypothetical protein [Pseudomonas putida]
MIKQRSWGDCGIATLANAAADNGVEYFKAPFGYELMSELFEGRKSGMTIQEVSSVLYFLGFRPMYLPFEGFRAASGIKESFVTDDEARGCLVKRGEKAILQVKTESGMLHLVYFDGRTVWDPSPSSDALVQKLEDYEAIVDGVFFKPRCRTLRDRVIESKAMHDFKHRMRVVTTSIPRKLHELTGKLVKKSGGL